MGRARGQIGAPARTMGGGLFSGLVQGMAAKLPPNERVTPKKDAKVARAEAAKARAKQDVTDEQLAECRRAFEAGEKTCKELAAAHGVTYDRMHKLVSYATRSSWRTA